MIVFDVEADNLLEDATKIHCLSYTADGSSPTTLFKYDDMRKLLLSQQGLIGHNIIGYDIPLLEKLLGIKIKARLFDTLPMSWVLNYNRPKHGLDSFGEDFGIPKPVIDDWHNLTQEEYAHRCSEDVRINWALWCNLLKRFKFIYNDNILLDKFFRYLEFKMRCASSAERVGWRLDKALAESSIATLVEQQVSRVEELKTVMPRRKVMAIKRKPKVCFKKDGTPSSHGQKWFDLLSEHNLPNHHDDPISVVKGWEEPNPNSPDQVKEWLFSMGWEPCTFDYKKNEDDSDRLVPQVRKDGELTPSVKVLIDKNPTVEVLDGLTVIQHRKSTFEGMLDSQAVSYTHLTLPTNREV